MKLSSPEARADATQLSRALLLLLVAFVAACVLRFPAREIKTMHTDEATQAVKLHEMMDGQYRYDPKDHHGPTLLYSRVVMNWLSGTHWEDMTESKLRLTPVLYGVALLLLLVLAGDGMGKIALAWSAIFIAVSPLMVFYSRYFIMEILLVFFTFGLIGCGWRYFITRKPGWLVWAGIFAGLMHATKETCVLHFIAMGVGLFVVYGAEFWSAGAGLGVVNRTRKQPVQRRHLLIFLAAALLTSVILFSQFLTKWGGVADSVGTYFEMLKRSGGQGHEKPFGYYFQLLWGGTPMSGRPADLGFSPQNWAWALGIDPDARRMILTERALILLAVIGCITAFAAKPQRNQSNHLVRFLAVYSVAAFFIYSLISYKTPWCIMGAWHGLLLMAGLGAERLVRLFWNIWAQRVVMALLGLAAVHLGLQAWRISQHKDFVNKPCVFEKGKIAGNPFNYSMTTTDLRQWVEKFHRFAELHEDGYALSIVQWDRQGGWPLPWYLSRKFTGYHWEPTEGQEDTDTSIFKAAVLLTSDAADEDLRLWLQSTGKTKMFNHLFGKPKTDDPQTGDPQTGEAQSGDAKVVNPQFLMLTSSRHLYVYIRHDLWQKYIHHEPPWEPLPVQQ